MIRFSNQIILALLGSICVGVFCWLISGSPPYGHPNNELSNNYWGFIINIARQWRSLDFSSWHLVAGGTSLFTSGQYFIANPTNVVALILNDQQFYLFKLIEPYLIGFFGMSLFLMHVLRVPVVQAYAGALLFLGLPFVRGANFLVESPTFLWGFFLFPTMFHGFCLLIQRHPLLAMGWVGCVNALIFAGSGVIFMPQMIVWWVIYFSFTQCITQMSWQKKIGHIVAGVAVMCFMSVALVGFQFIPTLLFARQEGARLAGHYLVNNFSIFGGIDNGVTLEHLWRLFFIVRQPIVGVFIVLFVVFIFGVILTWRLLDQFLKFILLSLSVTLLIYFSLPTCLGFLVSQLPFLENIFSVMTLFTFRYGVHIIDFFFVVLILGLVSTRYNHGLIRNRWQSVFLWIEPVIGIVLVILFILSFYPLLLNLSLLPFTLTWIFHSAEVFFFYGLLIVLISLMVVRLAGKGQTLSRFIAVAIMLLIGFVSMWRCYNMNDKGKTGPLISYGIGTPEMNYFQQARKQYFLPVDQCPGMFHNYPLLNDVYGVDAFLPIPPYRISRFINTYHSERFNEVKDWASPQLFINQPSASLLTYFPVEFTAVKSGTRLDWPGFKRIVEGQHCDMWQRDHSAFKLRFANQLKVVSYDTLIGSFDKPFAQTLLIEANDAKQYGVYPEQMEQANVNYTFKQNPLDKITIELTTDQSVWVIVPQMFQHGWRVYIDGKRVVVVPAEYLFMAFKVPAGQHQILMQFSPPGLFIGVLMTIIALALMILSGWFLFRQSKKVLKK